MSLLEFIIQATKAENEIVSKQAGAELGKAQPQMVLGYRKARIAEVQT